MRNTMRLSYKKVAHVWFIVSFHKLLSIHNSIHSDKIWNTILWYNKDIIRHKNTSKTLGAKKIKSSHKYFSHFIKVQGAFAP